MFAGREREELRVFALGVGVKWVMRVLFLILTVDVVMLFVLAFR